ncbi:hypothetical protein B0T17DRAFT_106356 [Bombardia bombarda]|uniref:Small ribosomal subunit protein uS4m n=1 Tax=Bombardia bombarda TaxID=252184 RepID=A0AA40CFX6_9PEZI|nr:hypothetical protein B0T17DRAFT_106356 [Bombardia bombarda]
MKYRRIARFHGLNPKRTRIRQTWNKYNLYNIFKQNDPRVVHRTFFQQKWTAKANTRAYHGEHIRERTWQRMFSRRLPSVVAMEPSYMAKHDGSEQAAGRGSGRDMPIGTEEKAIRNGNSTTPTPFMQMTYAPMERRLDIAVFRALFASSARQARQFCVHGAVTVNGMKMRYPGYLLNPGDLFQVNVERVLTATGCKKETTKNKTKKNSAAAAEDAEDAAEEVDGEEAKSSEETPKAEVQLDEAAEKDRQLAVLRRCRKRAKYISQTPSADLSAKQKKALRSLIKEVESTASIIARRGGDAKQTGDVVDKMTALMDKLDLKPALLEPEAKEKKEQEAKDAIEAKDLALEEERILKELIEQERENPIDSSKPYYTPWKPRPYMAPFAFIPRYLEVNPNICAAVYLRHPVARQGRAEVPTPFSPGLNQLAFNWYLRRG